MASSDAEWTTVQRGGSTIPSHPLYTEVSRLNGEVNRLSLAEVKEKLKQLGLNDSGTEDIIYKRLKNYLRLECIRKCPGAPWELRNQSETNPYGLDYLCVVDFEATCEDPNPVDYVHEIIEFPVLLLNLKTFQIDGEFHYFCKPSLNPVLSAFCKRLTGISQAEVDRSLSFPEVLKLFDEWLETHELGSKYKFALVTDCPWDIKECLFPQCILEKVSFPSYASKWIDARKLFASFYRVRSGNLSAMLESFGLRFEGREHSGIADSRNIVKVITQLIKDGCILKYNRFISNDVLQRFGTK